MTDKKPLTRTVTIVDENWFENLQDKLHEATLLCDKATAMIREVRDGDCYDTAVMSDLVERKVIEIRRILDDLRTPF